jgi:hypothetical protein
MTKQEFLDITGLGRVIEHVNSLFDTHKTNHAPKEIHTNSMNSEPSGQKEGEIWTFDY